MDYSALAALAGVVWDDSNRWLSGHQARVLLIDGESFYHPCTCELNAAHDALVPTLNVESAEVPNYAPLPDPITTPSAAPPPDPSAVPNTDTPPTQPAITIAPTDPNQNGTL